MQIKCNICGSQRLELGRLVGMEQPHFIPRDAKGLASSSKVDVEMCACADCGNIMWSVEPEELRAKANLADNDQDTLQTEGPGATKRVEPDDSDETFELEENDQ